MQATSKDLRFHTKEILDAAMRGEEVIITYRGKPCAKIVPINKSIRVNKENEFCGMWRDRDDMDNVDNYVRKLREARTF